MTFYHKCGFALAETNILKCMLEINMTHAVNGPHREKTCLRGF